MGIFSQAAVEGCANEILEEINKVDAKYLELNNGYVQQALAELRDFVEEIRATAEAGYY